MRLLRMQSEDGIYRGGKLLGIRLIVSVFDRWDKGDGVSLSSSDKGISYNRAGRGKGYNKGGSKAKDDRRDAERMRLRGRRGG